MRTGAGEMSEESCLKLIPRKKEYKASGISYLFLSPHNPAVRVAEIRLMNQCHRFSLELRSRMSPVDPVAARLKTKAPPGLSMNLHPCESGE